MKRLLVLLVNILSAIALPVAVLLIKLRLRRAPDPWRRTVGVGLRSEASKFALSAFGLQALSPWAGQHLSPAEEERHLAERLAKFLQTERDAQFTLRHDRFCSYRVENPYVDVILAEFAASGELRSIRPVLDDRHPVFLEPPQRLEVEGAIVEAYNQTRQAPECARALLQCLEKRGFNGGHSRSIRSCTARYGEHARYGERVVKGCCVSFEAMTADRRKRFEPPDFRLRRVLGAGFLNFVCRRSPGGAIDVWMQVHHTGADGSPMQELLTRLENAWGTDAGVRFPPEASDPPEPRPCHVAAQERRLYLLTEFLDFSPLLLLRRELKTRLADQGIQNIPLGSLFLWCLAHQPEFGGVTFASAVEVPANQTQARAVDLVPICPADYLNADQRGFADFVRDFNQLILDARDRRTRSYRAMRNLALLPPALAAAALRLNPAAARSTFGTVGVSMVRDGKVVVGTMADHGFDGGFIVIGNVSLPCADGRITAVVSIKGDSAAICHYPGAIRRAIQTARACFGTECRG